MVQKVLTRVKNAEILAFSISGSAPLGPAEPDARFPVLESVLQSTAVARHLDFAMYTTPHAVTCINRNGKELWRYSLDVPPNTRHFNGITECAFSYNDKIAWVYRPDQAFKGGDFLDTAIAIDATSGVELSSVDLGSSGHAASFYADSDGEHMLLGVGEGQDGGRLYRLRLRSGDNSTVELSEFEFENAPFLLDVCPDFSQFITVDEDSFVIRSYPSGDVIERIGLDEFGHEDAYYAQPWPGGYLDLNRAVVYISGETDDDEDEGWGRDGWNQPQLIDVRSGEVLEPCGPRTENDIEEIILPEDGSLLTEDSKGKWHRGERNKYEDTTNLHSKKWRNRIIGALSKAANG